MGVESRGSDSSDVASGLDAHNRAWGEYSSFSRLSRHLWWVSLSSLLIMLDINLTYHLQRAKPWDRFNEKFEKSLCDFSVLLLFPGPQSGLETLLKSVWRRQEFCYSHDPCPWVAEKSPSLPNLQENVNILIIKTLLAIPGHVTLYHPFNFIVIDLCQL